MYMNLRFSFEELSKKPVFVLLTIIQLIISFLLIYICISNMNYVKSRIEKVNNIFQNKEYYVMDASRSIDLEQIDLINLQKYKSFIENKNGINIYSVNEDSIFIEMNSIEPNCIANEQTIQINNSSFRRAKSIYLNNEFAKNFKLELISGSFYGINDSAIPVVLGTNYIGKVSINDVIPYAFVDENGKYKIDYLEVTGFLKKENNICKRGSPENIINTDDYIVIIDLSKENSNKTISSNKEMVAKINLYNYLKGGYFSFDNYEDVQELEALSSEFGLNVKFESLNTVIDEFRLRIKQNIVPMQALLAAILIFTTISIITVMFNMFIENKYIYGINIMVGATVSDIMKRIFLQIFILFSFSIIIVLVLIKELFTYDIILKPCIDSCSTLTVIVLLICILISVLSILKLKKHSINSIMRRRD
uniref:FtsX-like family permease n=3 Tax=Clostridium botulinum TaxID=1491 RepID=A0A126JIX8_CLOBO|nr:FtsX-like family permease [Clostridium botulinum]ALT05739.1 FtsX-like family permease [Clostridium botulinum]ALT05841.1 FtsX-like family permease [Clostridium botulinum]